MGLRSIGVCFLLYICFIEVKGSSEQTRFIKTEENLLMNVTEEVKLQKGDIFNWWINQSTRIIRLIRDETFLADEYKNRVDFFKQNFSLILKKVQLSDSGIYTAVVSGASDKTLATYDVTVQAPVSPVSVEVDSVSNSPDACNFTVSCRSDHSSISRSFTCDRLTCEEIHSATPGPTHLNPDSTSSLTLNLSNVSIICNHSNQVSWTQDTKNYREICENGGTGGGSNSSPDYLIPVIVVVVVILLLALFFAAWRKFKNNRIPMENTVYDVPECPLREPRKESTEAANTIYSEVQPHSGPVPVPVPGQNPESLYATVNKPQVSAAPLSLVV